MSFETDRVLRDNLHQAFLQAAQVTLLTNYANWDMLKCQTFKKTLKSLAKDVRQLGFPKLPLALSQARQQLLSLTEAAHHEQVDRLASAAVAEASKLACSRFEGKLDNLIRQVDGRERARFQASSRAA